MARVTTEAGDCKSLQQPQLLELTQQSSVPPEGHSVVITACAHARRLQSVMRDTNFANMLSLNAHHLGNSAL